MNVCCMLSRVWPVSLCPWTTTTYDMHVVLSDKRSLGRCCVSACVLSSYVVCVYVCRVCSSVCLLFVCLCLWFVFVICDFVFVVCMCV